MDLGVGVYKDSSGATVIMKAVREAEKRLYDSQTTKTYLGMGGDDGFNKAMLKLVFGDDADILAPVLRQTAGGTGALRTLAELLNKARPGATVWLSDPTWANHLPILKAAGLKTATYPYFDAASGKVKFDAMIAALKTVPPGDVVLLHGCCHNPTGANLTARPVGQGRRPARRARPLPLRRPRLSGLRRRARCGRGPGAAAGEERCRKWRSPPPAPRTSPSIATASAQ
jgi:aspartate/tyrosine/aromatic aminotransferase